MRILHVTLAAAALSLAVSGSALACEFKHQASKNSEIASTTGKPLVDRLMALAQSKGVEVKTQ
jgi:hypothetical protein